MKQNWLKNITIVDRIKNQLRKLMGYKEGKRFIIETEPYIKNYSEVELDKIANIEKKLEKALKENDKAGKVIEGIREDEARLLVEWVVQRDREILNNEKEPIKDNSLLGYCGLSQGITSELFINMGLNPRISNVNPTITGDSGRHAYGTVAIPIREENAREIDFLVDVTYRQFFLRDEVSMSGRFVKDKRFGNKVAPEAGYWCINLPGGKEFAQEILKNGYVELTPENAKIYGDSFMLAEQKNSEHETKFKKGTTIPLSEVKRLKTGVSGEEYVKWFKDPKRQDWIGIDYDEGELEEWYGDLMKTPLMKKTELEKDMKQLLEEHKETISKEEKKEGSIEGEKDR